jgi:hypothetical protein
MEHTGKRIGQYEKYIAPFGQVELKAVLGPPETSGHTKIQIRRGGTVRRAFL